MRYAPEKFLRFLLYCQGEEYCGEQVSQKLRDFVRAEKGAELVTYVWGVWNGLTPEVKAKFL